MKSFKKFAEAKDEYCSDKCCGSDVKAEDCKCPPDCEHCNCNSVSENLEEYTNWSVRHPTKSTKSYKVKARNTGEALKKAHKAAVKAGDLHKQAPRDSMLYKHVKKEEVSPAPTAAERDAKRAGVGRAGETFRDRAKRLKQTQTESLSEERINEITAQYINENNITMAELEAMSPEQLDEFIGKAVGGAFKLGAKAAVGTARLAGKGIKKAANRMSTSGRADAAEKKASDAEKKAKDRERIRAAKDRVRALKQKQAEAKRNQNQQQNKPKPA